MVQLGLALEPFQGTKSLKTDTPGSLLRGIGVLLNSAVVP